MAKVIKWRRKPVLIAAFLTTACLLLFINYKRTQKTDESFPSLDEDTSHIAARESNSKEAVAPISDERLWPELNGAFDPSDPGEGGVATNTKPEEEMLKNKAYAEYGFNQFISDKISLHRSLSDPRFPM